MDVVTGSFGYIGKYITRELLARGWEVKTITTHPAKPNPFGERVEAAPYNFENPDHLTGYLEGCETLYNTYWVRFDYRSWSFQKALENTRTLFDCAKNAGVKKIVHVSVTNPSLDLIAISESNASLFITGFSATSTTDTKMETG